MKLFEIDQKIKRSEQKLEDYFSKEFSKTPPLVYLSCDLRHSGFKLSVVDTNLFPAGFNNLCNAFTQSAVLAFKNYFEGAFPQVKKILIFPEAHTRNRFYFESLVRLSKILQEGGFDTRAAASADLTDKSEISLANETRLKFHPIEKKGAKIICTDGWVPDLILSNNDFSSGPDSLFEGISQPLIPPMQMGWFERKKSAHFEHYQQIAQEVGALLDLDPWFLSCLNHSEAGLDLSDPSCLKQLAVSVDKILSEIQNKYEEHRIESTPYVFIKNNSGTYGMGITYVTSGEEVLNLNRRTRNKMLSSKGGGKVSSFLIQEGIVTNDFYSGYPIEPVIYMVGEKPIGGFFRLNEEKDEWSSLNTKGMAFSCLCLHKLDEPHESPYLRCSEKDTLVKTSFFMARMAALAAARELKTYSA